MKTACVQTITILYIYFYVWGLNLKLNNSYHLFLISINICIDYCHYYWTSKSLLNIWEFRYHKLLDCWGSGRWWLPINRHRKESSVEWSINLDTGVSSSQIVDLALPLFYFSFFIFIFMLFYFSIFLFLEQLGLRVIGHTVTSVTTW